MGIADQTWNTTAASAETADRREARIESVRVVEYTRFPRISPEMKPDVAFTRDLSRTGMCIGTDRGEEVGALLRLCVRDVSGRIREPVVARVVWSRRARDERHWIGLRLLADTAPERAA